MSSHLSLLERGLRLAQKAEASIQGSNGSTARLKLVDALAVGLGLDDNETVSAIIQSGWNERCLPPWSERELQTCIPRIRSGSPHMPGYLLADRDRRQSKYPGPAPMKAAKAPVRLDYPPETLSERASKQPDFPILRHLTDGEMGMVARLRQCPIAGVEILCQNCRLMVDPAHPDRFVLTDGRTNGRGHWQYRTFDGSLFHHGRKSDNFKNSAGKGFFQVNFHRTLDPDDLIIIAEGSIALLELVSCQWLCEGRARRWSPLASHSAASTFACEPDLLTSISRHHVRILPDAGLKGMDAARRWSAELREVGCTVDFVTLPDGCQDLKRLLAAGSDGLPAIKSIFSYPNNRKGGAR